MKNYFDIQAKNIMKKDNGKRIADTFEITSVNAANDQVVFPCLTHRVRKTAKRQTQSVDKPDKRADKFQLRRAATVSVVANALSAKSKRKQWYLRHMRSPFSSPEHKSNAKSPGASGTGGGGSGGADQVKTISETIYEN